MKNKKPGLDNKKIIIIIIAVFVLTALGMFIVYLNKRSIENSTFTISKILLYHGAEVITESENKSLDNLNISQFSDLSIYINNNLEDGELNDMNTIKEMYIDNISIVQNNLDHITLVNYKNPNLFGKYTNIEPALNNRIDFQIIKTNSQNQDANYDVPTFFTDCSNPIGLGYLNKNIVTNYSAPDKVDYNAKVLREANISLDEINNSISFVIHITNNLDHKFYCKVNLNLDLNEYMLEDGYSYMEKNLHDDTLHFIREKDI